MIIDEEIYLEHFGVKGMRWGVRKQRRLRKYGDRSKGLTKQQKQNRRQRNFNRASAGLRVAVGAIVVASMFSAADTGPPRTNSSSYTRTAKAGVKSSKDIINESRNVKIAALRKTFKEGHIDKDQLSKFESAINKRYDRKVAEALKNI